MPYPDWRAGQKITADLLAGMQTYLVEQGSNLSVTSSTAFVDSDIVIPLEENAIYEYHLCISYSAGTGGDANIEWTVPSGATMLRSGQGLGQSVSTAQTDADRSFSARGAAGTDFGFGGTGSTAAFEEHGTIECGSTSGNAVLQWSQRVSNATATTLLGSTFCTYRRIG